MAEEENGAITFETFRKFQRKEKKNEKLQELPENFFKTCVDWINRKQKRFDETGDSTVLREIENVKNIVSDIFERRRKKILLLALHSVRSKRVSKNLLPEEKRFFEKTVENLRELQRNLLEKVLEGKKIDEKEKEKCVKEEEGKEGDEEEGEEKKEEPRVETRSLGSEEIDVKSDKGKKLLRITEDVERFVATDNNNYGPLEEGDLVTLPEDVAELLLKKNKAKESEV